MDLILFDGLSKNEQEIMSSDKSNSKVEMLNLSEFDVIKINDYKKITIYTSLFLNFVSKNFITFVEKMNANHVKKVQIDVIFVENLDENAKIAIDWLTFLNDRYSFKFKIKSEIDRFNLKDEFSPVQKIETLSSKIDENQVTIYTDGACSGNPGPGGWGAILFHGSHKKEISGFEANTTNNRMEITAVIRALEMLKAPCTVELYSDSAYVVNAIKLGWLENWKNNGWIGSDKKPVKNIEYWKRLDELMQVHQVNFNKVKGHADNEFNNRCDELATGEIASHAGEL